MIVYSDQSEFYVILSMLRAAVLTEYRELDTGEEYGMDNVKCICRCCEI